MTRKRFGNFQSAFKIREFFEEFQIGDHSVLEFNDVAINVFERRDQLKDDLPPIRTYGWLFSVIVETTEVRLNFAVGIASVEIFEIAIIAFKLIQFSVSADFIAIHACWITSKPSRTLGQGFLNAGRFVVWRVKRHLAVACESGLIELTVLGRAAFSALIFERTGT